jgi:hypothetical protein
MTDASFNPVEPDALVDPRLRGLVERYARLAGATLNEPEPELVELSLPDGEIPHFNGRHSVRVAFSLAALERHPDAEMGVVGGAFLQQLLDAVRSRGSRRAFGLVPAAHAAGTNGLPRAFRVRKGSAEPPVVRLALHPAARLVARVAIKAGAIVSEHISESGVFDLATGDRAPEDVTVLCRDIEAGKVVPGANGHAAGIGALPARPLAELVPLMLGDIQSKLATELARHRLVAQQALAAELARLDRYYRQLLEETAEPAGEPVSAERRRAVEAEHGRRRAEEERRHEVRATVHPLQFVEFEVLVQRVDWNLVTRSGRRATLTAHRTLSGAGAWRLACPHCGGPLTELLICRHDHVACVACGHTCRVCGDEFCGSHGIAACHVDDDPVCDTHATTCPVCNKPHCTAHAGRCSDGDHPSCSACLGPCAICGKVVCATHSVRSDFSAPRGERRLCLECTVYCEGKTSEPVGRDEAVRCASCEKFVCVNHRAACVVDQFVHCSTHLLRADRSRRLVCEQHRGHCSHEPDVVFASDELKPCPACGKPVCSAHAGSCVTAK